MDCKQSTEVLADLSDTFLNNYDDKVQNHTEPKGRDVSLSESKLISEQENDTELTILCKLGLIPHPHCRQYILQVELHKVPVYFYVRNSVLMQKVEAAKCPSI